MEDSGWFTWLVFNNCPQIRQASEARRQKCTQRWRERIETPIGLSQQMFQMQLSVKWCLRSHYHPSSTSSYFKSLAPCLLEPETSEHMDCSAVELGLKQVALLLCVKWRVHWNVVLENGQSLLKTCWSLLRCTCRNVMWKIFFYTGIIIEVQFLIIPPVGAISLIFHKSLNLFSL